MDLYAPYNTLRAYKVNHKLILSLAESLSDEAADELSFTSKDEMLAYLRKTFLRTEEFIEKFYARYLGSERIADEKLHKELSDIRWNLYYYLMHHCRHLGMMEALKGLLTGNGSAAA